jgi:hypothetical protein
VLRIPGGGALVRCGDMPLAQRSDDTSESRYCGVEASYNADIAATLHSSLDAGFDFVLAPLVSPRLLPLGNRSKLSALFPSILLLFF